MAALKGHQTVDELQDVSHFSVPRSVQEAREAVHSHTFCPACFVGLSIVEETYLWVLLYYSDAMVSEPRGLNGRSRAHLPL